MSEVKIGENESFEAALKRFNRKIQQDGVLAESRRRRHIGHWLAGRRRHQRIVTSSSALVG